MSLLRKLALVIVGVGIPSLVLYMGTALWFAKHGIKESVSVQQLEFARQTMAVIDHEIHDNITQLHYISDSPEFLAAANSKTVAPATQAVIAKRFNDAITVTESWSTLRMVRASGLVEASSITGEAGKQLPEQTHYKTVVEQAFADKDAYSDVFLDEQTKQPTMLIAQPVTDGGQGVAGAVLVGTVSWPHFLSLIQETKSTSVELFNKDGYELGDSSTANTDEILKEKIDSPVLAHAIADSKEGTAEVPSIHEDEDGIVLAAYVRQQGHDSFKGLGWTMIAATPTSTAYAAINSMQPVLVPTFIGLATVIYAVIILLIYRTLIYPLRLVTDVTRRIATGDLSSRIGLQSKDEIGQLATSFNRMTDKLQELYRGLEAKVQEKTSQLAERVRESETARARDEAILAGMGEGLVALDANGHVVLANVFAADLFGIPRDKLLGGSLNELIDGLRTAKDMIIDASDWPDALARETRGPVVDDYLYHRYKTDGERLSIIISTTPIFNGDTLVGTVLVVRDTTKEKEVDRMKTEFISLASHQLRTPLSAIKWFSEMLENGDVGQLNPEQLEFAKNITESTERMVDLVNSLLNISRIESGRIIVDPHPTDLKELIAGIVKDLQGKTQEKYQELVISVNEELPQINLDTHLIGQVYLNLLTNAIKYTPQGGKIMVLVSRKDDQIVTQVSDNGHGIPIAQQGKVFQKFFRADNVAKIETDGTGLGLYLVKAIIESSGGKIWFKSEEGKGTTFWFSLPLSGMQAKEGEVSLD